MKVGRACTCACARLSPVLVIDGLRGGPFTLRCLLIGLNVEALSIRRIDENGIAAAGRGTEAPSNRKYTSLTSSLRRKLKNVHWRRNTFYLSDFGHIWVSLTLRVGLICRQRVGAGPSLDACSMLLELGRRQSQGFLLGVMLLLLMCHIFARVPLHGARLSIDQ